MKADLVDVPADRRVDFCLICTDNGLKDRYICEGDTLYIHEQSNAETGQVVVVSVDGQPPIARVAAWNDKGLILYASTDYEPIVIKRNELHRVVIIGRVVQATRDI